ncbi:MAG: chorismate mutase [Candidatus Kapabacteria bacterium]|nr:chorismate mutase [Candidatus Kapabacteria bacterium]
MIDKNRDKLLQIDSDLINLLADRMKISYKIAEIKHNHAMEIIQNDFWNVSSAKRKQISDSLNLNPNFIEEIFALIHKESIKIQQNKFKELDNV